MASGKSTLGKILVQRFGLDYLDTDTLIEKQMLWKKKAINFSYKHLIHKDIDSRTLELKYQYENRYNHKR